MFGRTRAAPAFIRSCKVYLSARRQEALVAPMFNHAGLLAERPGAVVAGPLDDTGQLGQLTRVALDACVWQPEVDYRDRKRTDWPAFQQSGCRSVREFESVYDGLLVCGANEANLVWEVRSPAIGPFDLSTIGTIAAGAGDGEMGRCLLDVWNSYRQLRERPSAGPAA